MWGWKIFSEWGPPPTKLQERLFLQGAAAPPGPGVASIADCHQPPLPHRYQQAKQPHTVRRMSQYAPPPPPEVRLKVSFLHAEGEKYKKLGKSEV